MSKEALMLNPSLNAFRPDLADARLQGQVKAEHFVKPTIMRLIAPIAPLKSKPDPKSGLDSQALLAEVVRVFEQRNDGWAWVQLARDGYVGYMPTASLGPYRHEEGGEPTHCVCVPRSFVYPSPDLKLSANTFLSLGAGLILGQEQETRGTIYRQILNLPQIPDQQAWIVSQHVRPIAQNSQDFVSEAESLIGTPYLWGGKSSLGLDCSGLVQLACQMAGIEILRDASMQEKTIGKPLDFQAGLPDLKRGDLIFWKGHVGIMSDSKILLHANGYHMAVAQEPLKGAMQRIANHDYGAMTAIRRLPALAQENQE
ncbi:MAG: C40 family peptidase [Cohaesibacter sp.]|nr:C40 family peptidase [Cohaesibacter sp.]